MHARERRKERGEERALLSRAFIYARVHLLVSRVLLDGLLRKKRDCSYSRMITIHGVPNSVHKVVTHGEKKGKGSARRRERRLTLSLACVAGDLAASAVVFWRRSRVKIGSKSRRDFNLSLASNGRSAAKKVPQAQ